MATSDNGKKSKGGLQEAQLWHKERNGVRCDLCAVNCFIVKDKSGACQVRTNHGNVLYTDNNTVLNAVTDTVERRPLFHFYPGSKSLSVSGLAFDNWFIEHDRLPKTGKAYTPESLVKTAEKAGVQSISYTFAEPTIFFEYVYKTAKLAHRSNIKNIISTTGVISEEAIKRLSKYMDAVVVHFKASGDPEFMRNHSVVASPEPIFSALRQMKKQRMHIEVTNTIIPQIGDSREKNKELVEWISSEISPTVPYHLLQFHPDGKLADLPFTPISQLDSFAEDAGRYGMRYVYIGNLIEPHQSENTYCYNCREPLLERVSGILKKNNLQKDRCSSCGVKIDIVA